MSNEEKLRTLFNLGEVAHNAPWPDYLRYGFSVADVPTLVGLVGDLSLHQADVASNEVWVPLHAWRTLGQLGNEAAVEPLLALLDDLIEDDWVRDELPTVLGLIGVASIEPLGRYLRDSSHNEFSRVVAAEALKCVVENEPDSRIKVLAVFNAYLAAPDKSTADLNGLLLCCLVDLKAVEMINAVQEMFETSCVDVSYAGEFDAVKQALESTDVVAPLAPPEGEDEPSIYDEIDETLLNYARPTAVRNASELDGFFAALGCAPETIVAEAWLAAIWGGEDYVPQWADKTEADAFVSAVLVFYNRVVRALNGDTFSALYMQSKTVIVANDWCQGFLRGVNMWQPLPRPEAALLEKSVRPMRLFATESGQQSLAKMSAQDVASAQREVEDSVRAMHLHWLKPRDDKRTPVLVTSKVGRNELCACGSGKKFKKCCLH